MKIRQFTEDQIIKLLQEGKKGEKPVEDLCRDFGCSTASYYAWKKKYGDTNADEARRLGLVQRVSTVRRGAPLQSGALHHALDAVM